MVKKQGCCSHFAPDGKIHNKWCFFQDWITCLSNPGFTGEYVSPVLCNFLTSKTSGAITFFLSGSMCIVIPLWLKVRIRKKQRKHTSSIITNHLAANCHVQVLNTRVTHRYLQCCGAQGCQESVEMLGVVWLSLVVMMDHGKSEELKLWKRQTSKVSLLIFG